MLTSSWGNFFISLCTKSTVSKSFSLENGICLGFSARKHSTDFHFIKKSYLLDFVYEQIVENWLFVLGFCHFKYANDPFSSSFSLWLACTCHVFKLCLTGWFLPHWRPPERSSQHFLLQLLGNLYIFCSVWRGTQTLTTVLADFPVRSLFQDVWKPSPVIYLWYLGMLQIQENKNCICREKSWAEAKIPKVKK